MSLKTASKVFAEVEMMESGFLCHSSESDARMHRMVRQAQHLRRGDRRCDFES
jgi:hypothetical protein